VFQKELHNFRMCIITFTSVSRVEGKDLLDESAYFLTFLLNDNQPRSTIYDELNLSIFCLTLSSTFFRDFLSIMNLSMFISVCVCSCLCMFLSMCVSVCMYFCLCMFLYVCTSVYVCFCLCTFLSMYVSIYVCSVCLFLRLRWQRSLTVLGRKCERQKTGNQSGRWSEEDPS